jgi:hypothetical protein
VLRPSLSGSRARPSSRSRRSCRRPCPSRLAAPLPTAPRSSRPRAALSLPSAPTILARWGKRHMPFRGPGVRRGRTPIPRHRAPPHCACSARLAAGRPARPPPARAAPLCSAAARHWLDRRLPCNRGAWAASHLWRVGRRKAQVGSAQRAAGGWGKCNSSAQQSLRRLRPLTSAAAPAPAPPTPTRALLPPPAASCPRWAPSGASATTRPSSSASRCCPTARR